MSAAEVKGASDSGPGDALGAGAVGSSVSRADDAAAAELGEASAARVDGATSVGEAGEASAMGGTSAGAPSGASALGGASAGALSEVSVALAGGVIGRPVGGVGVSSDGAGDGADVGVAAPPAGARVTASSGPAAGTTAMGPVRVASDGAEALAVPDRRTAPSNGSGASHSTPAGGSCRTAEAGRPCQTYCSASTPP